MNEQHFGEIERVLLLISGARKRAASVGDDLERDGAEAHLVEALRTAEKDLEELHRRLMQGTYWAVPDRQMTL